MKNIKAMIPPRNKKDVIARVRELVEADGKKPPAEKTLYAKLSEGRGIQLWLVPYFASALGVTEQDLFDPSKRHKIAKEEVRKDPFRYLDEIEDAAVLKHAITAEVMSVKAAAGTGNNIESIDVFTTGRKAVLDSIIFKAPPKGPIRLMQVDGYSMVPMLYPDSWVIYEDAIEYTVDGLYVINYSNELMVKLLQFNPEEDVLEIISKNPEYKSWKVRPGDQSTFQIVGKVLRCII
ncbi:S24 family peptidase [Nitratifractor salsuginis]|uniref:S24 family peptidase n=1 Tax=Nitratifractor salsuginis TaxID=269261 RepID=UPI0011D0552B|nr:S24 family peptidase [Nitratifractor salsuginis]